jgi:hypothetical protein
MKRLVILLIVSCSSPIPVLAQDSPLDARVTIDYRDTPAADVIGALARGAGLSVQIGIGTMRPVTITLTNVKLENALNAICDNALCVWHAVPRNKELRVNPLPSEGSASLPLRLSFAVYDATISDLFRALAAAIGVRVTIDPNLESAAQRIGNAALKDGYTVDALNLFCENHNCEWDFDAARGLRVTKKR